MPDTTQPAFDPPDAFLDWLDDHLRDEDPDGSLAAGATWHDLLHDVGKARRAATDRTLTARVA